MSCAPSGREIGELEYPGFLRLWSVQPWALFLRPFRTKGGDEHPHFPQAPLPEGLKMVGLERFELSTSCTPCKRATRLRYSPKNCPPPGPKAAEGCAGERREGSTLAGEGGSARRKAGSEERGAGSPKLKTPNPSGMKGQRPWSANLPLPAPCSRLPAI